MTTTILNTTVEQRADWEFAITVKDAATKQAIDISTFGCKMQGVTEFGGTPLFTITEVNTTSGRLTPGADGTLKWRLRASVTALFTAPSEIFYDILLVAPDGSVIKPVRGTLTVVPGATAL